MKLKRWLTALLTSALLLAMTISASAAEKIVFVPHDNRPISDAETAQVAQMAGYDVVTPPKDILSGGKADGTKRDGNPDAIWQWTKNNVKDAKAVMISSDSLIYGGLVPSRKHELSQAELTKRVNRFAALRKENPNLNIYVFASVMRTPRSGLYSGTEEPDYYQQYGADIFQTAALLDKQRTEKLSADEQKQLAAHQAAIPADVWQDWTARRAKNEAVTKQLIDLTREGDISYLVVGKDDNAPYSQTHREGQELAAYGKDLGETQFQVLPGIDEFGLLLLTRAANDMDNQIPFVYVDYNKGTGANTMPSYSDTKIGDTIKAATRVAGGILVNDPKKADLVLMVNTNYDGKTGEANIVEPIFGLPANNGVARKNTKDMIKRVNNYVAAGYPVGIADIAFGNGADNALMQGLEKAHLLYKLRAYAGWNTPTNSTGFALGMGMLANRIANDDLDRLLTLRYLEDWGYQANVRTQVGDSIAGFRRWDAYIHPGTNEAGITQEIQTRMRQFALNNLPPFNNLENLQVTLPWHRMFEAEFNW